MCDRLLYCRTGHFSKSHGHDDWVTLRHLPVFGRATYLRFRPRRYRCPHCEGQPTTTQALDWYDPASAHTMAYDDHILLQLVNSTVEDVNVKERLSCDSVLGVLERRISARVDWSQYSEIGGMGLGATHRQTSCTKCVAPSQLIGAYVGAVWKMDRYFFWPYRKMMVPRMKSAVSLREA